MKPLSGPSRDMKAFGQVVSDPMAQVQPTSGTTDLVADSALSSDANLQQLAKTRVPVVTEPNMSKCVSHPLSHVPRMPLRPLAVAGVLVAQQSYEWGSNISRRDSRVRTVPARDAPDRRPAPRRVRHGAGPAPLACTPYSR
jgi:hypothetical protein